MSTDRAAVMQVVREFFTDSDKAGSLLWGPLREWMILRGDAASALPYEHRRILDQAEIVELTPTQAVVEVRAEHRAAVARGSYEFRARLDGPAVLEKCDDGWRILDFTVDGRRRLESVVIGPLAEQENQGVLVRVVGADRSTQATEVLLEVVNGREIEIRLERAFILFGGAWDPIAIAGIAQIGPASSSTVSLSSGTPVELSQLGLPVAVSVRAGRRKIPFLLQAPLVRPPSPFRQPPPRRLPLLRKSQRANLALYAAATAAIAWLGGWLGLGIPVLLGLLYWQHWRVYGLLPERLHRVRFLFDALVLIGAFLVLWETPAAELAVPFAVGILVYAGLRRFARAAAHVSTGAAVSAALTWWFLLGGPTGPLSVCRLVDGRPGTAADSFTHALLVGDFARAHRDEPKSLWKLEALLPAPVSKKAAAAAVGGRSSEPSCQSLPGGGRCYVYRTPAGTRGPVALWVDMTCDVRRWRVARWFG